MNLTECQKIRLQNPYFWGGLACAVIATLGVDPQSLTSWTTMGELITGTLSNPIQLFAVCGTFLGIWVDGTTKGFADSDQHGARETDG